MAVRWLERLLDQRPLLAAGDGQHHRVGGGADQADASMLPRIGPVSIRIVSKCFLASSISRRRAAGDSVLACSVLADADRQDRHVGDVGRADVFAAASGWRSLPARLRRR